MKIPIEKLYISFHDIFFDYYIPGLKKKNTYITGIGTIKVGFGSKTILQKVLDEIRETYGDYIDTSLIEEKNIPKIENNEVIIRRLGSKQTYNRKNLLEKLKNQKLLRRQLITGLVNIPTSWQNSEGYLTNNENVWRPNEEKWWPLADFGGF